MCVVSKACSAVQVSWNISPGITLSGIGEIATVYVRVRVVQDRILELKVQK